jgi:hypothetical protein
MEIKDQQKSPKSFFPRFLRIFKTSVTLGVTLSVIFFLYNLNLNSRKSRELVENLTNIEKSLSTRHIGIFPNYLPDINKLLSETLDAEMDTTKQIVIFEDVLFYGAFYRGQDFKEMITRLFQLSSKGKKITIAYYDNGSRMFREVVQESWMQQQDLEKLAQERQAMLSNSQWTSQIERGTRFSVADSIVSEKYFAIYCNNNKDEFARRVKNILTPLCSNTQQEHYLFNKIDEIKNLHLNKPLNILTFSDFNNTYKQMTEEIKAVFQANNFELIPLNTYLVMSCWSNGEKVLFAFPGKFAADEVGFISQDPTILKYINTMLQGVKVKVEIIINKL